MSPTEKSFLIFAAFLSLFTLTLGITIEHQATLGEHGYTQQERAQLTALIERETKTESDDWLTTLQRANKL